MVKLEDSVPVAVANCQPRQRCVFADFGEDFVASPYGERHDVAVSIRTPHRLPVDNDQLCARISSIESMLYCALSAPNEPAYQRPGDRLDSPPDNHGDPVAHKDKFFFLVFDHQ